MKKISLFIVLPLLLTTLINSPSGFAATRGIRIVAKTGQSLYLYKNYHALVVGVSDYEKWPRLPNAVNDAKEVASKLKELGFEVKLVLDPSSREMKTALSEMVYDMGIEENRAILFYYAGHGETETLADKTKMGYIIPRDCPILEKDPKGFATHAISMRDIESVSMRIKSKHVLMLFDSCFSGSLFSLVRAVPDDITEKSALPVRQYITAGREDEQVPDKSMFKRCLLLGLEGDADLTGDGYITGSELGMYLSDKVVNYTHRRQHPQYGKINNPDLDRGDFIFALKRPPKEKGYVAVAPPRPPEPKGLPDYEAIIKERRAAKKKWAQWQVKIEEDFAKAEMYDESPELTAKEKVGAWAAFLSPYSADNPYSTKDDELREKAEKRRRHWKEFKVAIVRKPTVSPGKKTFTSSIGMKFVLITTGSFMMGSRETPELVAKNNAFGDNPQKPFAFKDEHPVHKVKITKPFYMQTTEVTVSQFQAFVSATSYITDAERQGKGQVFSKNGTRLLRAGVNWKNPGFSQGDDHPVVVISWNDAKAFTDWLNEKERTTKYRLPTEAEWEYACRAGSDTAFYWGNRPNGEYANIGDSSYSKVFTDDKMVTRVCNDGCVYTAPVGSYRPNSWGLFDMCGNAIEWCQDRYAKDYYSKSLETDPQGPPSGNFRVVRGGGWPIIARECRSASRYGAGPDSRNSDSGFRVATDF